MALKPGFDLFGRPIVPKPPLPPGLEPLKAGRRWVLWRYVNRDPGKKPTKVPYQTANPSVEAKSNDPATWSDFHTTHAARDKGDGIGFVLSGCEIGAFDLDDCRDPVTLEIAPWAMDLVRAARSYTEVSISGTGLRIIGYAKGDKIHRRQKIEDGAVETYRRAERYIVVTGDVLDGFDQLADIDRLMHRTVARLDAEKAAKSSAPVGATRDYSDSAIELAKLPAKLRDLIVSGVPEDSKRRSDQFHHVVGWLKDRGHAVGPIADLLSDHPDGIAAKYAGRVEQEVQRAWGKAAIKPEKPAEPDWMSACMRNADGHLVPNVTNALLALQNVPEIADLLSHDSMSDLPMLSARVPNYGQHPEKIRTRPVRDVDVSLIQVWLQRWGMPRIGNDVVHKAVAARAAERSYHPVRRYLEGLKWDRMPRIDSWLSTYAGAENTRYTAGIGAMFLLCMVARIVEPGCKSDYLMVLEGPQGVRKSTACSILGGEWFSDSLPDLAAGKDVAQHLKGKWLVEISELSSIRRAEAETLKAFISRPVERYRPSYGRMEVVEPRMNVFVGTTNRRAYLRDETGGRRFWPVTVGLIDTDALKRDRDQLFAEAVHAYRAGRKWWPDDAFEREHVQAQQEDRFEVDAWEDSIQTYLRTQERVTVSGVAQSALHLEAARLGTSEQRRISAVLERLEWRRAAKDRRGTRWWVPPVRSAAE